MGKGGLRTGETYGNARDVGDAGDVCEDVVTGELLWWHGGGLCCVDVELYDDGCGGYQLEMGRDVVLIALQCL